MNDHIPYLWDKSEPKDPEVERLENLLSPLGHRPRRRNRVTVGYLYAGFALAATLLLFGVYGSVMQPDPSGPLWSVHALAGAPRIDGVLMGTTGGIGSGQWLVTDDSSAALVDMGFLGKVRIEPGSRLKVKSATAENNRFWLDYGMVYASVWAPPRQFAMETPSGVVVDLGCEYTLNIHKSGNGILCVESGWVSLEHEDRVSLVPTGAQCELRPGVGPGTPYLAGASSDYIRRLQRFDFEPAGASEIRELIDEATPCEAFSLVYLVDRVNASYRGAIYDRIATVHEPWPGITRDGIVALDAVMLADWREQFECYESDVCRASCIPEPF